MSVGRLVFVTFELYPLTSGGIGRALYNILMSMSQDDRNRTTVVIVGDYMRTPRLPQDLRGIDVIFADINDEHGLTKGEAIYPPRWAFKHTDWHWRSYVALRSLRELADAETIAYIEFTDWGGLGHCATQEKKLGVAFSGVPIAIRLHGPHGVLLSTERYIVSETDIGIFDLERSALGACDLIIAQTKPYFDKVREVFGFDRAEWERRYFYSPPPVIIDSEPAKHGKIGDVNKRVIFTSKFQHIKRPEIFVRGVAQFLHSQEGKDWEVAFCAHITDAGSKQRVVKQIPPALRSQFRFITDLSGADRDEYISTSVVVVSSACESFCLSAFEASLLGAVVVLNESNPSFGTDTLWHDGENCLKFDGTARGLAKALKRAASSDLKLEAVAQGAFKQPWLAASLPRDVRQSTDPVSKISIVLYGAEKVQDLSRTMQNISQSNYDVSQLILAIAGETDEELELLLKHVAKSRDPRIKLVVNLDDLSQGAILNDALCSSDSEITVFLAAGDLLHPAYLQRVEQAFQNEPALAVLTTHVGYFDASSTNVRNSQGFAEYGIAFGQPYLSGHSKRWRGEGPVAIRRAKFEANPFSEELQECLWWSFYRKQMITGKLQLSFNAVYGFVDNSSSMRLDRSTQVLEYHELLQTTSSQNLLLGSAYLTMSMAEATIARRDRENGATDPTARDELLWQQNMQERTALDSLIDHSDHPNSKSRWSDRFGISPRRSGNSSYTILRNSLAFDARWYLQNYPDVAQSGMDPVRHYLNFGAREGRFPNPYFDTMAYLSANPDVRNEGINPLLHYILYGKKEGRPLR